MSAAVHAEDHRGGDDAPAEVTMVQPGPLASAAADEWLAQTQRYLEAQRKALEEFFGSLPEESPFHWPPQEQQDPSE